MSEKYQIVRKCKDCPEWTQTVCHHAFGVYWCVKSGDGEGCKYPLDDVAEKWRKAGWTPDKGKAIPITLPVQEPPKTKSEPPKVVRKPQPKKVAQVQLDLISKPEPPPLSDDDY